MHDTIHTRSLRLGALTLTFLAAQVSAAAGVVGGNPPTSFERGAVYTSTNDPAGNEVAVYTRETDGSLSSVQFVATGGLGTGAGLGNQGAVRLSEDEEFLFVVNAGSNDLSVFRVLEDGLELLTVEDAEGQRPVSVDERGGILYVVNAGSDSIAGFRMTGDSVLRLIPGSRQPLSSQGTAPAQVEFSQDGRYLYVTEKATNIITRFVLDAQGRPRQVDHFPSAGLTPFGFAMGKRNQMVVSEAAAGMPGLGTVTSYRIQPRGFLGALTSSAATNETASCWIALSPDGRIAFTTNTASDTITAFEVAFDGRLTEIGEVANTGAGPTDVTLSNDGRFLYVLDTQAGFIGDYVIENDANLTGIPGSLPGLPSFSSGLAAR